MINLEEHKIYVDAHKMEMVPLSVAKEAVEEAYNKELDKAIKTLSLELTSLKPDLSNLDDKNSTRKS
jgi:prolyl-tRNA editing enzyme YbaK/EbsC (Cys-tRNA(Pro) deacylase)